MDDRTASEILAATWKRRHGKAAPKSALRVALAIACHESAGTYGSGEVSYRDIHGDELIISNAHNWGSAQAPPSEQSPCAWPNFRIADSRPPRAGEVGDPKFGGNVPFWVCMKGFRSPEEGADYFLRTIDGSKPWQRKKTWAAIQSGKPSNVATAMYDEHYYGGFGKTREERIDRYSTALTARLTQFMATIGDHEYESAEDPGVVVSGDVIVSYLKRVNQGYDALYDDTLRAPSDQVTEAQSRFVHDYIGGQYPRWKEFYENAVDDWIPWGSTYSETRTYQEELAVYEKRFKEAFKRSPSQSQDIPKPSAAGSSLETFMVGGLIIAGLFGVGYAIRSVYTPRAGARRQ